MVVATVTAVLFINCYNQSRMQQTILFKVPGKPSTRPLVILTGPSIGALSAKSLRSAKTYSTNHFREVTKKIVRAVFSARASMAVIGVCLAAMWWHIVTVDDTLAAQTAVGRDCLCALPWAITWVARLTRKPMPKKGGMK